MIFARADANIIAAEEKGDKFTVTHGQNIGPHLKMCQELREHDPKNGKSALGHFQHIASLPEITAMQLEQMGIMDDPEELKKWLKTDVGREFRTSKDVVPIKGDGLQLIVK